VRIPVIHLLFHFSEADWLVVGCGFGWRIILNIDLSGPYGEVDFLFDIVDWLCAKG
jgi:hypothetical protein